MDEIAVIASCAMLATVLRFAGKPMERSLFAIDIEGVVVVTLHQEGHRFEFRVHPGGENLVRLNQALIATVNDPDLPFDEMDADSVLRAVLQLQGVMP